MSVKSELEKLKPLSWRKRLEYIGMYYKWWIIGTLFVLIFLGITLGSMLENRKETVLSCMWVNDGDMVDVGIIGDGYADRLGIDRNTQRLMFESGTYIDVESGDSFSLASQSKLSAMWNATRSESNPYRDCEGKRFRSVADYCKEVYF